MQQDGPRTVSACVPALLQTLTLTLHGFTLWIVTLGTFREAEEGQQCGCTDLLLVRDSVGDVLL